MLNIIFEFAPASGNVYVRDADNVPDNVNCVLVDIPDNKNPRAFDETVASIIVFDVSNCLLAICCTVVVST